MKLFRVVRQIQELSQKDVAHLAGLNQNDVSLAERGLLRDTPHGAETRRRIALVLGVAEDEIPEPKF